MLNDPVDRECIRCRSYRTSVLFPPSFATFDERTDGCAFNNISAECRIAADSNFDKIQRVPPTRRPFSSRESSRIEAISSADTRPGHSRVPLPRRELGLLRGQRELANFPRYIDSLRQRVSRTPSSQSRYGIFRERKRGRISLEVVQPGVIEAIREPIISLSLAEEGKLAGRQYYL